MKSWKQQKRQQLKSILAGISPDERADKSHLICQHIQKLPQWQQAVKTLLFWPLPDEPDIRPLLSAPASAGKQIFLPRISGDQLLVCPFEAVGTLTPHRWGHLEPPDDPPEPQQPGAMDLILVPGLGFSRSGERLGRGKGFYDRLLAEAADVFKAGVCFDPQLQDDHLTESHDIEMDVVITESGPCFPSAT